MRLTLALSLSLFACRSAPDDARPAASPNTSSPATAMPEDLRCKVPADCTPEPRCYWGTPSCVAVASVVTPTCGADADPPRTELKCGCDQGQCVALTLE